METEATVKPVILVVDDDPDLLMLLQHKLKAEGYKVHISPNGANLMDIIAQDPPDLVLLDIRMEGIDGGTVCQLLKSNSGTSKMLVFLFSANDNIASIASQCGADGYITKPYQVEKFREIFKKLPGLAHSKSSSGQ